MEETATTATVNRGHIWPQTTRDYAYELWALDEAGDCTRIAARLNAEGYGDVPARTVRHWRDVDAWDHRLAEAAVASFPITGRRIAIRLMLSADDGAGYVQRVNAGTEPPNKLRLAAAQLALDRVGFDALGRSQRPQMDVDGTPTTPALPDLAGKSADELEAMLRDLQETRR